MYSGEFTIELINKGRYQCEYRGTPRNIDTCAVFFFDFREIHRFLSNGREYFPFPVYTICGSIETGGKEKC